MKKLLTTAMLFASAIIFAPSIQAKPAANTSATLAENAVPQVYRQRINRRGVRVVNRTRIVRQGRRTYREVYQTRYQPNGRVVTRLISRTRIR